MSLWRRLWGMRFEVFAWASSAGLTVVLTVISWGIASRHRKKDKQEAKEELEIDIPVPGRPGICLEPVPAIESFLTSRYALRNFDLGDATNLKLSAPEDFEGRVKIDPDEIAELPGFSKVDIIITKSLGSGSPDSIDISYDPPNGVRETSNHSIF